MKHNDATVKDESENLINTYEGSYLIDSESLFMLSLTEEELDEYLGNYLVDDNSF